ncbi:PTS lactose/cellobiose transporter subunit IIA [Faecalicoccus pleomorphus]|uniref:PTS lactose/cellobiose transporter subunit IIA n=1 Tax=Faecalicoccus pleomorphus TaxID=1323 RepID=A0AAW6CV43_9FIRM|nr:PTS lactose/cellobiose transporter subunit IIA [Faecalicoccus pleomorphus]MDB7980369.1 PTS lactose/cellobiose transporter subunit IIA [Faecalicoccus pleomorphus]MDB7982344.1 PTS lactose/cellobiose transporter subunit IIA [Faecalicoccus pleomorphus]
MSNNEYLTSISMKIIWHSGNARTKANKALDELAEHKFDRAKELMEEARNEIILAHQAQTKIIQEEASGEHYEPSLLFSHAQDTLMTIMSELNITEKLIMLFETLENKR